MLIIKKIKIKFFLGLAIICLTCFSLTGCARMPQNLSVKVEQKNFLADKLKVIFLDVGQGDSTLIITPEQKNILVDGGPDDKILSQLGKFLPLKQKKIDMVILTHPHADHLDGLVEVMRRYEVGEIYYTGFLHTTNVFLEWLNIIKSKNIPLHIIKEKQKVEIGGAEFDFLYPQEDLSGLAPSDLNQEKFKKLKLDNLNNTSLVFKLVYGRTQFLFMGDAELPIEKYLINQNIDLSADVLKVGHHGSNSSTSEDFLKLISPQSAVISVGANNDFGHPHLRTLRRLERYGISVFRTDENGDVEILSDGEKLEIKNPQSKVR